MKLAIVGTGIAGNVAAYKLRQDHDITVFEAGSYVGGHTNTIDVDEDMVIDEPAAEPSGEAGEHRTEKQDQRQTGHQPKKLRPVAIRVSLHTA